MSCASPKLLILRAVLLAKSNISSFFLPKKNTSMLTRTTTKKIPDNIVKRSTTNLFCVWPDEVTEEKKNQNQKLIRLLIALSSTYDVLPKL